LQSDVHQSKLTVDVIEVQMQTFAGNESEVDLLGVGVLSSTSAVFWKALR
jgi:hypothetical protein